MNSKVWFEDVKETINTLKNEVTPNLLYKIVQRRITDIPNRIFDRGKEMLQSEYIDSPTLRVTMYEDDQEKHPTYLPTETDRWMKKHGQWFDPYFHDKAKVNKLVQQLMQSDSGANRIVTDDLRLLDNVTFINNYPMGGCNKDAIALICTAKGQLTLQDEHGQKLQVECYYSQDVDGTIVSPTAIICQHHHRFSSFIQFSNCDSNEGNIKLLGRNNHENFTLKLMCKNDLWYHVTPSNTPTDKAQINRLSSAAMYELWHQRTAHAGQTTQQYLHKHAKGVPSLKGNPFHKCTSCMQGKLCTKRNIGTRNKKHQQVTVDTTQSEETEHDVPMGEPGQHFHMDFGFIRGRHDSYDIELREQR